MPSTKRVNPRRRPVTQADVDRAKRAAADEASAVASVIMLSVLCDKECADRDTIRRVWGEVNELADSVITGYVSVADLRRTLCDEYDIII